MRWRSNQERANHTIRPQIKTNVDSWFLQINGCWSRLWLIQYPQAVCVAQVWRQDQYRWKVRDPFWSPDKAMTRQHLQTSWAVDQQQRRLWRLRSVKELFFSDRNCHYTTSPRTPVIWNCGKMLRYSAQSIMIESMSDDEFTSSLRSASTYAEINGLWMWQ